MPYNKLLLKITAESGYTHKEIIQKCNELGVNIDKTAFSKIINGKRKASTEISKAICLACNVDERILNIEQFLDDAPEEIRKAFITLKEQAVLPALTLYKNQFDEETYKEVTKVIKEEPIYDIVLSLADDDTQIMYDEENIEFNSQENNITMILKDSVSLEVKDNSMAPKIEKGSKINLEIPEQYKNGDIVAVKIKNDDNYIVRYIFFNENNITLTALSKEYIPITYKKEDINILGRVSRIITDI